MYWPLSLPVSMTSRSRSASWWWSRNTRAACANTLSGRGVKGGNNVWWCSFIKSVWTLPAKKLWWRASLERKSMFVGTPTTWNNASTSDLDCHPSVIQRNKLRYANVSANESRVTQYIVLHGICLGHQSNDIELKSDLHPRLPPLLSWGHSKCWCHHLKVTDTFLHFTTKSNKLMNLITLSHTSFNSSKVIWCWEIIQFTSSRLEVPRTYGFLNIHQ